MERKFGGRAQLEAIWAQVCDVGAQVGIDFAFEKIALRANTLAAHRLLHWAQQRGPVDALVEALFAAQFVRGEHLGDLHVLTRIAGENGFDAMSAANYLASRADAAMIEQRAADIRALGVASVPTTILAGRLAVVGAQEPATLVQAIEEGLQMRRDGGEREFP